MIYIHVLMAVLGSWRITEMMLVDEKGFGEKIFSPIRGLFPQNAVIQGFWRCPMCLSVWGGIISTALFVFLPLLNWPLAVSFLYLNARPWIPLKKPGVHLKFTPDGTHIDFGGMNPKEVVFRMREVITQLDAQESARQQGKAN